ncbi:MAG: 30S ribosomal protein S6 [Clostridia bacterium]
MNNYEAVVILSQTISDEEKVEVAEKIKDMIVKCGELTNVEEWGRKELAYEIKKQKEGFYILYTFTAKPSDIAEYDRLLRLEEKILKHMIIRK